MSILYAWLFCDISLLIFSINLYAEDDKYISQKPMSEHLRGEK